MHQHGNGIHINGVAKNARANSLDDSEDEARIANASSMLRLPTDALLCILYSLDILDILKIRQTCTTLRDLSFKHSVWTQALQTLRCYYDIPRHTYAPREMTAAAVEEVVLRPYRFERNIQAPTVQPTSTRLLTTRVGQDEMNNISTNILPDTDHTCTCVTVIRGGRFIVTGSTYNHQGWLRCWDMGAGSETRVPVAPCASYKLDNPPLALESQRSKQDPDVIILMLETLINHEVEQPNWHVFALDLHDPDGPFMFAPRASLVTSCDGSRTLDGNIIAIDGHDGITVWDWEAEACIQLTKYALTPDFPAEEDDDAEPSGGEIDMKVTPSYLLHFDAHPRRRTFSLYAIPQLFPHIADFGGRIPVSLQRPLLVIPLDITSNSSMCIPTEWTPLSVIQQGQDSNPLDTYPPLLIPSFSTTPVVQVYQLVPLIPHPSSGAIPRDGDVIYPMLIGNFPMGSNPNTSVGDGLAFSYSTTTIRGLRLSIWETNDQLMMHVFDTSPVSHPHLGNPGSRHNQVKSCAWIQRRRCASTSMCPFSGRVCMPSTHSPSGEVAIFDFVAGH